MQKTYLKHIAVEGKAIFFCKQKANKRYYIYIYVLVPLIREQEVFEQPQNIAKRREAVGTQSDVDANCIIYLPK